MTRTLIATLIALLLAPSATSAQQPPGRPAVTKPPALRVYASVDGGYQAATKDFANGGTFTQYLEQARFDSTYEVKPRPHVQISGGVGIWRRL